MDPMIQEELRGLLVELSEETRVATNRVMHAVTFNFPLAEWFISMRFTNAFKHRQITRGTSCGWRAPSESLFLNSPLHSCGIGWSRRWRGRCVACSTRRPWNFLRARWEKRVDV